MCSSRRPLTARSVRLPATDAVKPGSLHPKPSIYVPSTNLAVTRNNAQTPGVSHFSVSFPSQKSSINFKWKQPCDVPQKTLCRNVHNPVQCPVQSIPRCHISPPRHIAIQCHMHSFHTILRCLHITFRSPMSCLHFIQHSSQNKYTFTTPIAGQ